MVGLEYPEDRLYQKLLKYVLSCRQQEQELKLSLDKKNPGHDTIKSPLKSDIGNYFNYNFSQL